MVKVVVWGSLQALAEGKAEVEVEAETLRELLQRLGELYPGLEPQLKRGISVAIDGRIYNDSWFKTVAPDSEVVLLPRLSGG
ncbi:MoaD/ThiS family protein [Microbaculum sp. FT89]|uniref:MoaD/ThiS family protein n=1 Tax=Microbaculum sp. FT89 TaxID=3447298 RepID=UPI003F52F8C3